LSGRFDEIERPCIGLTTLKEPDPGEQAPAALEERRQAGKAVIEIG
jgi:hypothetical protein